MMLYLLPMVILLHHAIQAFPVSMNMEEKNFTATIIVHLKHSMVCYILNKFAMFSGIFYVSNCIPFF